MQRPRRFGWLAFLLPVLVCAPCFAAPLLVAGGATVASALGGTLSGSLWVAGAILLVGAAVTAGSWLALRRRAQQRAVCCAPAADPLPHALDTSARDDAREPVGGRTR